MIHIETLLMCKDVEVLNITTLKVLNHGLLPGLLFEFQSKEMFLNWFRKRYSERSNTASRQLRGILFGQGNRKLIDKATHALSLSDCYWIKSSDENISFSDISPYYNDFWNGEGKYSGEPIPTLYVNGFLTKYWKDKHTLIKKSGSKEILCSRVAKDLQISVVDIYETSVGIAVTNFTSDEIMFESAEVSGKLDPEDFTVEDILSIFGEPGFDMIFFDAIIGNGDRHAGNFGFLRNADSGVYVGMAPLFDFDHAYESNNDNDILIKEVIELKHGVWADRFDVLIKRAIESDIADDYMKRRIEALR